MSKSLKAKVSLENIIILLFMWMCGMAFSVLGVAMIYGGITNQLKSMVLAVIFGFSMFCCGALLIFYPFFQLLKSRGSKTQKAQKGDI